MGQVDEMSVEEDEGREWTYRFEVLLDRIRIEDI